MVHTVPVATPSSSGAARASSTTVAALLDELVGEHPGTAGRVARLRELVASHGAREAELAALNEAARDLTKVRDLEHALQAVTDRTRRLLACDVAYLSARTTDEEHFAVRAWAGQLSPAFLGTRVSVGRGVGGQVAGTRRPFQVANYLEADAFAHSEYLDSAVSAEGLVALLGVPLEVDGRLLGILFAGRRRSEAFSDAHVELMSSLAAHAAVALDNAHLFISQRAALEELEKSTALLRAHTAAVETAADVHGQLTSALLRGDGIDRIVEVVALALDGSLVMVDDAGRTTATAGPRPVTSPLPDEVVRALVASREVGRAVGVEGSGAERRYVAAATAGTRYLGALVLTVPQELTDVDTRTLERATQTVAISVLADVAAAEADVRAASETMRVLLAERRSDIDTLVRLARRHGLVNDRVSVVASTVATERLPAQIAACAAICRASGGLSALVDGVVVTLSPLDAAEVAAQVWEAVRLACGTDVTVAATEGPLADLPGCHGEALQTLELMRKIGRDGSWALAAEFGAYSLLLTPGATAALDLLVSRQVGTLLDHDERHRTELSRTALSYLDCACSATAAARDLGVHVNTVTQRLARIDRVLGAGWRSGPRQLDVHNALRLHELRGSRTEPRLGAPRG
ncbi:helix-turn-helix domain-containing protein [Nocardioides hwasunensis]|uniref:GAF domain-containing protein n=1 Tax=Nocardioides hwasunensis TaxID=397258 RepID=A0ABR8MHY6_9ACTN|nr:GAF domain-containing protein [Nocardioides hwasunensis]MBD3915587.1 GAF domain-containing protein [Nocardioides hwasunensis]